MHISEYNIQVPIKPIIIGALLSTHIQLVTACLESLGSIPTLPVLEHGTSLHKRISAVISQEKHIQRLLNTTSLQIICVAAN